jgi:hypothetical protein
MLRRFADADGYLWVLDKPSRRILPRRRSPKTLCFQHAYYVDDTGDFDKVIKEVERRFAKYYQQFVDCRPDQPPNHPEPAKALLDWAAMLGARAELPDAMIRALIDRLQGEDRLFAQQNAKRVVNLARPSFFHSIRGRLAEAKQRVRCWDTQGRSAFVVTDNPICVLPAGDGHSVVALPLSSRRLLMIGAPNSLRSAERSIGALSKVGLCLAGWANSRIHSGNRASLQKVRDMLDGDGPAWVQPILHSVRQPHMGIADSITSETSAEQADDLLAAILHQIRSESSEGPRPQA